MAVLFIIFWEDLILIAEDGIVDVELLLTLGCQHKRLHEASHGLPIVGQLPSHLNDHSTPNGWLAVHLPDFGMAIPEIQGHDLLVDFLEKKDKIFNLLQ
jgi:hypothetical protein